MSKSKELEKLKVEYLYLCPSYNISLKSARQQLEYLKYLDTTSSKIDYVKNLLKKLEH